MKAKHFVPACIATAVIAYGAWFFSLSILTNGDWGFYNPASQKTLLRLPSIWDGRGLGTLNITASFYPLDLLWGLLAHITNFALSERLIFLWPSILACALGSFFQLKWLLKSSLAALLGSFVYTYNGYFMILRSGDLTLAVAYALAPFIILMFMKALEERKMPLSIGCGLLCFVASFYEFRIFYVISWVLIAFILYQALWIKRTRKDIGQLIKYSAPVFLIVGLLNAFWLIGLSKLGQLSSNAVFGSGLFGSEYYNISEAITLFHPFWSSNGPTIFNIQPIPLYFWLFPALAVMGLVINRRNSTAVFFAIVGVTGVLLTKQQAQPFVGLYLWLFKHVPGFNAFREASKFYFLIAISYAFLIASLVRWAQINLKEGQTRRIGVVALTLVICSIALVNVRPLLRGEAGTLFVSRQVPNAYKDLNNYLLSQNGFIRTAWLPTISRWGVYDDKRANISVSDENNKDLALLSGLRQLSSATNTDTAVSTFSKLYAQAIYSAASTRFFVVPLRDQANDDDFFREQNRPYYIQTLDSLPWLHRVNIGTKDVAVYENPSYKPHFSALTSVVNLDSLGNLEKKYSFITGALKQEFAFAPPNATQPGTTLRDPFQSPSSTSGGTLTGSAGTAGESIYINAARASVSYQVSKDTLSFMTRRLVGLQADGHPLGPQIDETKVIDKTPLRATGEFVLGSGQDLWPLDLTDASVRNLGAVSDPPVVYSVEAGNWVVNGNLGKGQTWQQIVEDCNHYDNAPIIGMNGVVDDTRPDNVVELTADRHTACTGPGAVAVKPGETLMLQFDYRVVKGSEAGYQLVWNGPGGQQIVRNYLPVSDSSWRTLSRVVSVPAGATSLRVLLEAFPNEQNPVHGVARYTDVRISGLHKVDTPPVAIAPAYTVVPLPAGTKTLSVSDPDVKGQNLIPNPDFAQGLWQKTVGDCNAYDADPSLGMRLDPRDHSTGSQSLELTAKRHIACTSPPGTIPVAEGHTYQLSFNYQSPNASQAHYSVNFNDPDHTSVTPVELDIKDQAWHTATQSFTAPFGATSVSISVSADAVDPPTTTIINRYDNFRLAEITSVQGQYYEVRSTLPGGPLTPIMLAAPKKIDFTLVNPTKKLVHITGATTPFYLAMSEAYHPQWRLELANARVQNGANGWVPWVHPDAVPDQDHFSLDDFLNGWYVDPAVLCASHAPGCKINPDGSYNLQMVAEFAPQRWFYVGLIISVTTLISCLGYLLYAWRRKWPVAIQWTRRPLGAAWAWWPLLRRLPGLAGPRVDALRRVRVGRKKP